MITNLISILNTFFCFFYSITLFFILFSSCKKGPNNELDLNKIPVSITFDRFDEKFYNQPPEVIPKLKKKYPFLFPSQFSEDIWVKRQNDSLQLLLQNEVKIVFNDISLLESEVTELFKHIKYYFPNAKIPQVITLINNVDYQIKTVYSDSLLLISLDTFLGSGHPIYEGIPNYIRRELDKKYIPSQIVEKFSSNIFPPNNNRTFLGQIIYEGKKLYLKDLLLPNENDTIKIAYSKNELEWVKENEINIWKFFIEKKVLYQTNPEWSERFLDPSPFSKFYLQLDNETPGRIGRWVGLQIVRSFIKQNPNISIQDLIKLPPQKLFNSSKYKPNR